MTCNILVSIAIDVNILAEALVIGVLRQTELIWMIVAVLGALKGVGRLEPVRRERQGCHV